MRFVIVGSGSTERRWERALASGGSHTVVAVCPRWLDRPDLASAETLDDLLGISGFDVLILGGEFAERAEGLRRAAVDGRTVVVVHPPGEGPEAYDQVALTPRETGAVILPDLALRHHPALDGLRDAVEGRVLGGFEKIRCEVMATHWERVEAVAEFSRLVDFARVLLGEAARVTAVGDRGSEIGRWNPLLIQLQSVDGRAAEFEFREGDRDEVYWTIRCRDGEVEFSHRRDLEGATGITARPRDGMVERHEFAEFSPVRALVGELEAARIERRDPRPTLADGARASEIAAAAERSLRRGRTIELNAPEASELQNFKAVMSATGCGLFLLMLVVIPLSLAGPALGFGWTVMIAWLIPPALVVFAVSQLLRFVIPSQREASSRAAVADGDASAVGSDSVPR